MPIAYSADALIYDAGANTWRLRPDYDIEQHRVEITFSDDDGNFDGDSDSNEVGDDANQTAVITDLQGNVVASGQIYDEEFYSVWDGANPHIYIERVEIGGTVVGYLVDAPLEVGVSYTQSTTENVDADNTVAYSTFADVPCFATGTQIRTTRGLCLIEALKPGDHVLTVDRGPQPVLWVHQCEQLLDAVAPDERPVLIKAGALGPGRPNSDMVVSPQHRIIVGGHGQLHTLFPTEAFVPAKSLTVLPGIRFMRGKRTIQWHHFALPRHEVIWTNDCLTESLLLGPMVVNALTRSDRRGLMRLFGPISNGPSARVCLTSGAASEVLSERRVHRPIRRQTSNRVLRLSS